MITGKTRLLAIVGDPIDKARSPESFCSLFDLNGHDAIMIPVHVTSGDLASVMAGLVPARIAEVIVGKAQLPLNKPAHQVTAAERRRLVGLMQQLRLTISGPRPIDEAIITAGGVDTREVNPRTMESTLVRGLYFCGEVLDIDADTGGYNLQAAFSSGYLAGESAALAAVDR